MRKRRSYETGHRPKLLVVVDETPEADRALYWAARRAVRLGAGLVTLAVVSTGGTEDVWLGVGDMIRADAEAKADGLLEKAADRAREISAVETERIRREGMTAGEIAALIEQDEDITSLVLAAGLGPEGPGPLVSSLAGKGGMGVPVPVIIVPGDLSDAEIDALAG
ncbi:MAG: universal stress protein [Beijerinckiaceae bacterium]